MSLDPLAGGMGELAVSPNALHLAADQATWSRLEMR